jgi:hypothetical protein
MVCYVVAERRSNGRDMRDVSGDYRDEDGEHECREVERERERGRVTEE